MEFDLTLVSYQVARLALFYNMVLFLVWLWLTKHEGGHVSKVYLIILALFAVRVYGISLGIQARHVRPDHDAYMQFLNNWIWHSRVVPEAIVFIVLAWIMTKRFVRSYLFNDPEYRSKNGNRKADK
ncbi:MAG: hypothetical protein BBJ57_02425 [Desulfobacterales bacterium PC51MH44]|nr:MAG: hypothetical protein BBJ57_02425 [Desulfobacterales bacterium PC51MH44]